MDVINLELKISLIIKLNEFQHYICTRIENYNTNMAVKEKPHDLEDVHVLERILPEIENISITEYKVLIDEISKNQPFVISLILAYKEEYEGNPAFDEIIKNYLLIYAFFKSKGNLKNNAVTADKFRKRINEVSLFLAKLEITSRAESNKLTEADFRSVKHTMLMFKIFERIKNNNHLSKLTLKQQSDIALEARCLIDCLSAE